MLRDITIGQYYPADSVIHRLDPRVKLAATFLFIISIFCVNSFLGFALAILMFIWVVRKATIPFSYLLRGLKAIFILLIFSVVMNLLLNRQGNVLIQFWIITITDQGVYNAAFLGLRLILLVVGSSLMTLTTTPLELTDGLEKAMRPLKKIHVPVHEIAMMMSIALRFIPILLEETDKIIKAQQARGADFETGSLMQRAKAMVPILVPLFISAFRRADDLATAMEARCYRGDVGRTRMKEMIYTKEDKIAYGIVFAAVAFLIATRFVPTLPQILEMAGGVL